MTGLEQLGFVRRERLPVDRRRIVVTPDLGRVALELGPHYASQTANLSAVVSSFTTQHLEVEAEFLTRLLAGGAGD